MYWAAMTTPPIQYYFIFTGYNEGVNDHPVAMGKILVSKTSYHLFHDHLPPKCRQ